MLMLKEVNVMMTSKLNVNNQITFANNHVLVDVWIMTNHIFNDLIGDIFFIYTHTHTYIYIYIYIYTYIYIYIYIYFFFIIYIIKNITLHN